MLQPGAADMTDEPSTPKSRIESQHSTRVVDLVAIWGSLLIVLGADLFLFSEWGMGVDTENALFKETHNRPVASYLLYLCGLLTITFLVFDVYPLSDSYVARAGWCFTMGLLMASLATATNRFPQGALLVGCFAMPVSIMAIRYTICRNLRPEMFYAVLQLACLVSAVLAFAYWIVYVMNPGLDHDNWWQSKSTQQRIIGGLTDVQAEIELTTEFGRFGDYMQLCPDRIAVMNFTEHTQLVSGFAAEDAVYTRDDHLELQKDCKHVKLIGFLIWWSPIAVFCALMVMVVSCYFMMFMHTDGYDPSSPTGELTMSKTLLVRKKVEVHMKCVAAAFALMCMCIYLMSAIHGASMNLAYTVLIFCGGTIFCLVLWAVLAIGQKELMRAKNESQLVKSTLAIMRCSWARGAMVIAAGGPTCFVLFVSFINQAVRKMRGKASDPSAALTPWVSARINDVREDWNFGLVMTWVVYWSILYVAMSVFGGKICFVFLSWFAEQIAQETFATVVIMYMLVGTGMFLIPVVPGVAVYMCGGLIIGRRCDCRGSATPFCSDPEPGPCGGWTSGVIMACGICFVLKLIAVALEQKVIGEFFGGRTSIQKATGVDKPFIRAIELILRKPGLKLDKVAVLVGGPDWPTSVLTGILKLNVWQMLLGTTPVITVIIPVVFAGGLLIKDGGYYALYGQMALMASVLGQGGAGMTAAYYIQKVVSDPDNRETLYASRKEHEAVEELTRQQAEFVKCFHECSTRARMPSCQQVMLRIAGFCGVMTCYILFFMGSSCFESFQINSQISAPLDADPPGLDGDVMNLFKMPGLGALGLWLIGVVLCFIVKGRTTSAALASIDTVMPTTPHGDGDQILIAPDKTAKVVEA